MSVLAMMSSTNEAFAGVFGVLFLLVFSVVGLGFYLLPTIIAVVRKRSNIALVAVVNILLGWSLVGWIVALVMALSNDAPQIQHITIVNQQGQSPVYNGPVGAPAPQSPASQVDAPQAATTEVSQPGSDLAIEQGGPNAG